MRSSVALGPSAHVIGMRGAMSRIAALDAASTSAEPDGRRMVATRLGNLIGVDTIVRTARPTLGCRSDFPTIECHDP